MNISIKPAENGSGSSYHYSPWFKRCHPFWEPVFEGCPQKFIHKNGIIYSQEENNEYVYFIQTGRVRLSAFGKNGNEKSIAIISEGNLFGEISAKDRIPAIVTATAITDCTLLFMPAVLFTQQVVSNPILSERMIQELMRMIHLLTGHIRDISFMDANTRVATYLFKLAHTYGLDTPRGRKITINFTHQEMADLTGTCRVTVSKIMRTLNKSRVIKKIDGHLYILDEAYLRKVMEEVC